MEQKKFNERIAMALLRQCALVWEYCTHIYKPVKSCELKLADVLNGTGNYMTWKKCPVGMMEMIFDFGLGRDVFTKKMAAVDGVKVYDPRNEVVEMWFPHDDYNPDLGYGFSFPTEQVFSVCRSFCMANGCTGLMNKTVFGLDGNGKFARLPEVKDTAKAPRKRPVAKQAAKASGTSKEEVVTKQPASCLVTTAEPTLAERLREVLLKQLKVAA